MPLTFSKKHKNEHKEWIKNGLELHKKAISKTCMFCGNDNIENAQKRWNEILKSSISKSKDDILSNLTNAINISKSILEQKSVYKKVCKNTLMVIDCILEDFPKRIDGIKENKKINSSFKELIEYKKDDFVTDQAELLKSVQIHLLEPYIDQYEAHALLKFAYKNSIKTKELELKDELQKSATKISDSINKKLIDLGYDRELKIKIDSRGGESKYSFSFVDASVDIAKLSDGQKHKLALAIFLVKLENHVGKINYIVLDDPVVTLDFQTYYRVKKEIVNLVQNNDIEHVILLTYNMSFLFIQLSNLFNSSDISICTFYHLNPNSCNIVDPNILNYDDLVLYKKCLLSTQTLEEFNILSFMNFRIMRIFIDMKARLLGIPDSGQPSNAILSLTCFDIKTKEDLQKLANKITKIHNDTKSKNSDLYESFVLLKEFTEKMNFGNFLCDENLNLLKKFSNSERRCSNYSGNNLLFLIIQWAFKIEHSNSSIMLNIKNYIHHPRNQLTNSVIGIDFTDSDGNFVSQP